MDLGFVDSWFSRLRFVGVVLVGLKFVDLRFADFWLNCFECAESTFVGLRLVGSGFVDLTM